MWWRLRPAQEILAEQPGAVEPERWVAAAQSEDRALTVVDMPAGSSIVLKAGSVDSAAECFWFDPVLGGRSPAAVAAEGDALRFEPPDSGDWVLVCR